MENWVSLDPLLLIAILKIRPLNDINMFARGLETHINDYYYFLVLFDYTLEKNICLIILNTRV